MRLIHRESASLQPDTNPRGSGATDATSRWRMKHAPQCGFSEVLVAAPSNIELRRKIVDPICAVEIARKMSFSTDRKSVV